jgi:hypothetical protein
MWDFRAFPSNYLVTFLSVSIPKNECCNQRSGSRIYSHMSLGLTYWNSFSHYFLIYVMMIIKTAMKWGFNANRCLYTYILCMYKHTTYIYISNFEVCMSSEKLSALFSFILHKQKRLKEISYFLETCQENIKRE